MRHQESRKDFLFIFIFFIFFMWTILKVFVESVAILLSFYVLIFFFFGNEARGILASGVELAPPALEGKVLTTGLLRKASD